MPCLHSSSSRKLVFIYDLSYSGSWLKRYTCRLPRVSFISGAESSTTPFNANSPFCFAVGDHLTGPQIDPTTEGLCGSPIKPSCLQRFPLGVVVRSEPTQFDPDIVLILLDD